MNLAPTTSRVAADRYSSRAGLCPVAPLFQPAQRLLGSRRRFVLAANPAHVSHSVERVEDEGIVDLTGTRLVAGRSVSHLHVTDAAGMLAQRRREIPLHALHVIDVVLDLEVVAADLVKQPQRVTRRGKQKARCLDAVKRLD